MASRVRADGLLDDLDAISEQMSRALGLRAATNGGSRGWLPPVDIWETQDELVIEIDAPGCDPQDLAAEVVDNQLVVSGERTLTETAARRYRSERWHGRFVRTFIVPPGCRQREHQGRVRRGRAQATRPEARASETAPHHDRRRARCHRRTSRARERRYSLELIAMSALNEMREREETASRHDPMDRWLAVSEPLAVDDDPDWENADWECWSYESRTAVRC